MPEKIDKERAKLFLKEYYRLCIKYGFIVDACGCCESPWLTDVIEPESTPSEERFSVTRIAMNVCRNVEIDIIRMHIEHLMGEAGFDGEEIKNFIQELVEET